MNDPNDKSNDVRVEDEQIVFDDFFRIKAAKVQLRRPEGTWTPPRRMLSFERGDAVAAVIVNQKRDQVVLIRQFRYPAEGWLDELVAGMLPADETPEQAIRREILEETGYEAGVVKPLGDSSFYVSPGGSSERIHLFLAEVDLGNRAGPGGGLPQTGEQITLRTLDTEVAFEEVRNGQIIDAKTVIGLQRLMLSTLSPRDRI